MGFGCGFASGIVDEPFGWFGGWGSAWPNAVGNSPLQTCKKTLSGYSNPPGRATEEQKQEYLGKWSTLIQQITQPQIDSNINQATQNITTKTKAIENAIAGSKQAFQPLETQDNNSAVTTYNNSIDKIATPMTQINERDELHKAVGEKLDQEYDELARNPDNVADNAKIDKL